MRVALLVATVLVVIVRGAVVAGVHDDVVCGVVGGTV